MKIETSALEINKHDAIWHTNEHTGESNIYYVTSIYSGRDPELQTLVVETLTSGDRLELEIENHPVVKKVVHWT